MGDVEDAAQKGRSVISIVIPVYNQETFLAQCLGSVLSQTLRDIEVICVDDGSTDSSSEMLAAYAAKDDRVKVLAQENRGVGAARNVGLEAAQGEFVIFCDPDDEYPDDLVLEKLYRAAKDHGALVAGGSFSIYDEATGTVQTAFDGVLAGYGFSEAGFVDYGDYQFDYGFMRFLFSRRLLEDGGIRFPGYRRYQDPPFLVRALAAAERFYAIPDVVYRYRLGHQGDFWDAERKLALLDGLEDVLGFAAEQGLARLYSLTVDRIDTEYARVLGKDAGDARVFARVIALNGRLRLDLLPDEQREGLEVGEGLHLLRPLRDDVEALNGWRDVDGSRALSLARAIAYLPRKLRSC